MLCLLLLGVVQLAVIVRDQLAVELAAREAARAAAVAADAGGAGAAAAHDAVALAPLDVRIQRSGTVVSATAVFIDHTDVPLIGALLSDVRVSATATMQLEPP